MKHGFSSNNSESSPNVAVTVQDWIGFFIPFLAFYSALSDAFIPRSSMMLSLIDK